MMKAKVWRNGGFIPEQTHDTDVGYDLRTTEDINIQIGQYKLIPLNIIVKPPDGYYFDLVPRSSTFKKYGIMLANSVGIIDPSYSSEGDFVGAMIFKPRHSHNYGDYNIKNEVIIEKGTRLFQLILRKAHYVDWVDMTGQPYEGDTRHGWGSSGEK